MLPRHYLKALFLGLIVIFVTISLAAAAEEMVISFGAGVHMSPDYEGSENYEVAPLAFARLDWSNGMYLEVPGPGIRANLIPNSVWQAGPILQYGGQRDDVENDAVDALRKVDSAFEVGGFIGFEPNNWSVGVMVLQDVADGHEGFLVSLGIGYSLPLSQSVDLSLDLSSTYASEDYMDAYFSIDADNAARSGLDTFNADAGVKDAGMECSLSYRPWKSWVFSAMAGYTRLLGDAADSPVVDDAGNANQYLGGVLVSYSF